MEINTETLIISASHSDTEKLLLEKLVSLLIYSKEWVIEKNVAEKSVSIKRTNSAAFIDIKIKDSAQPDAVTEITISSNGAKPDELSYAVLTIKGCVALLTNKEKQHTLDNIISEVKPEYLKLELASIEKGVNWAINESDRLNKESTTHLVLALNIVSEVIPDITDYENYESTYWDKVQPLSQDVVDLLDYVENELNLALGLGLDDALEAAMANFMLMSVWVTKRISEGKIHWNGRDLRDIPDIRSFARQIISLTRKYLMRDDQSMEALLALRLQRAAFVFLNDREGIGEAEHAIAKLKSLINAGFIETKKTDLQDTNSSKQRNNGKALEEDVKELLQSMGLKAATTKVTGDGGIDIVAYSNTPIFSGKYVVQCKDWSGSVGESVIRDLYGVVMAESANKGILITTGTITKSAQKFAEGKSLELIDGDQLSKLLNKYKS